MTQQQKIGQQKTFISVAFKRCLSHQKRKELVREYPKPQVALSGGSASMMVFLLNWET